MLARSSTVGGLSSEALAKEDPSLCVLQNTNCIHDNPQNAHKFFSLQFSRRILCLAAMLARLSAVGGLTSEALAKEDGRVARSGEFLFGTLIVTAVGGFFMPGGVAGGG